MPKFTNRVKHAWNAFMGRDPTDNYSRDYGIGYSSRPDRIRFSRGNERSIITSVYNRIAIDAAAINVEHARLDDQNRFIEIIDDSLNQCLTLEANIDQTGRSFMQDAVMSMLDEGHVAIIPIDTYGDPSKESYDILSMRTGKVVQWYPRHVKVSVYNDRTAKREEIINKSFNLFRCYLM